MKKRSRHLNHESRYEKTLIINRNDTEHKR